MQAITKVVGRVRGSTLDEGLKTRISERLDELLASYIVEDRILERVDDPSRPLHVRAFMLLAMCTPEMLPEGRARSEEHTSELQSLMRISYAVFCLKKKKINKDKQTTQTH